MNTGSVHVSELKKIFLKDTKNYNPRVGIEVEKIGLYYDKSDPPSYSGKRGYLAILGALYEELGWKIVKQNGKRILSMSRGGAFLHLESDGRIELAGSPHDSIHNLARELRIHQNEIAEISKMFGIIWIGSGYHPFVKSAELNDMMDVRKRILLDYFIEKKKAGNDYALAWHKKTSGIHVNIDFEDEEDFALKNKVFTKISPILTAMFANSPFSKRQFSGYMSFRSHVTHESGLPQFDIPQKFYESDFNYSSVIYHYISHPLLMILREGEWIMPNCTFKYFLENGYEGHVATMADFENHIKSAWMDIRSKSVIELRFVDSLPPHLIPSLAALVKGIAYDKDALLYLEELTRNWLYADFMDLRRDVAKHGLKARLNGELVLDIAKTLINLSSASLKKNRVCDVEGHDETLYVNPIKEFVFLREKSPAEWLVENWMGKWRKSFFPVVDWLQY